MDGAAVAKRAKRMTEHDHRAGGAADDAAASGVRERVRKAMEPFRKGRTPTPEDATRVTAKFFDDDNRATVEDAKSALKELLTSTGCNKAVDNAFLNQALEAMRPKDQHVHLWDFLLCWNRWMRPSKTPRAALVVVDVQHDFIDGSLALRNCDAKEEGAEVVPIINKLHREAPFDVVVYTKDWHPEDHISFHPNLKPDMLHESEKRDPADIPVFSEVTLRDGIKQTLWPPHCIQNTKGAALHSNLLVGNLDHIVNKGTDSGLDSYSAFYDNAHKAKTSLTALLREHQVEHVYCCGLAYDVCVGFTALDGVKDGFNVHVIKDACRSVSKEGASKTTERLKRAGVTFTTADVVRSNLM